MPSLDYLLTRDAVLLVSSRVKTNKEAAMYLNVSLNTWKKYAKMYTNDEGISFYDVLCNVKPRKRQRKKIPNYVDDVVSGIISPVDRSQIKIKEKVLKTGAIEEKCAKCNFNQRRKSDHEIPLILYFADGNKKNWNKDNIKFYCYNCFFLYVSHVYMKSQLKSFEQETPVIEKDKNVESIYIKQPELTSDDLLDTY